MTPSKSHIPLSYRGCMKKSQKPILWGGNLEYIREWCMGGFDAGSGKYYQIVKPRNFSGLLIFMGTELQYIPYFSLLPDIFLLPVRGCCALTDYLPEACRGQIIFRAQQPRTGNWKICLEVMKNKVYCHSRNERKLYARKPVVITIICLELPVV